MGRRIALLGVVCALGAFFVFHGLAVHAQDPGPILDSAESLFKTLKERNYKKTWSLLSADSQKTIVRDSLKAIRKAGIQPGPGEEYTFESISQDFASGGGISQGYWNGYLENFNPDLVLEQSKWSMGAMEKDRAEIVILFRKAESPARLQMVRENGKWKVALMETFAYSAR